MVALFVCMACNAPQKEVCNEEESEIVEVQDTIETDTLALADLLAEESIPTSMDELFDDFIFQFAENKKLQRERIKFPLMVTETDGSVQQIDADEWVHEYLFLHQDYYTVLFNNEEQMDAEKTAARNQVDVEWYNLQDKTMRIYHFIRRDGLWTLDSKDRGNMAQTELSDFMLFYSRFATDSVYQSKSISQPLRLITTDPDNDFAYIEGSIDADQWQAFCPQMPSELITNIRYGQTYTNPRKMVLLKRGIANGMLDIFTFVKRGRRWLLTAYEN